MKTREIFAALGIAGAITGGLALAAPANADRSGGVETDPGHVRSSLHAAWVQPSMVTAYPWNPNGDPVVSMSADGTLRRADMADAHRPSSVAVPQTTADSFGRAWDKSFCYDGESHKSERCRDAGH
jgi:hypothetical protein